jgi:tetraprenyl-beta-curcumene synthase
LTRDVAALDPAPLTVGQLRAIGRSAARELGWGLWAVRAELTVWRRRAEQIPDPILRSDALLAMREGRALVDGAALFWTLTHRRQPELLRLLVALQTLLNFLDIALERAARSSTGRPAIRIRIARDALDLDRAPAEIGLDDGGYLRALVGACRGGCATLVHYPSVQPILVRETCRARAFEIEHDNDALRRARRMKAFATREFGDRSDLSWWELTGGASSLLTAMVAVALAADEQTTVADLHAATDAYILVASAAALLDSYTDRADDVTTGAHNWFTYYPAPEDAARRTAELIEQALRAAGALRNGQRHVVIVSAMTALALSSDSVRDSITTTRTLASRAGTTTRALLPILRAWRIAYGQRRDQRSEQPSDVHYCACHYCQEP